MLEIFDGTPGQGKTFCAMALRILPHLAAGGYVVTNVEIVPDGIAKYLKERHGVTFNPDRLRFLSQDEVGSFFEHTPKGTKECPVMVVLDEIHLWFNARDWAKNDANLRQTFVNATQHRKYNLDITLISQHIANIDAQFIRLVAKLVRFRNLKEWHPPMMPWLRVPYYRFLATTFDRSGKGKPQKRDWLPFDPLVGGSYNTDAILAGAGASAGQVERVKLPVDPVIQARFDRIKYWGRLGFFVALGVLMFWLGRRGNSSAPEPAVTVVPAQPAKASAGPVVAANPALPLPVPPPVRWLDSPPKVEVVTYSSACGLISRPRLSVKLDGSAQWLQAGEWTSRGRVAFVRRLGDKLFEVQIWEDETGERKTFRAVQQNIAAAVAPPLTGLPPEDGFDQPATQAPHHVSK